MKHIKPYRVYEVRTQRKDRLGQGFEHDVYGSKLKPDFVIKKFTADEDLYSKEDWQEMLDASVENPEIFAKIGRISLDKGYFTQEKLDERGLTRDFMELGRYLFDKGVDTGDGDVLAFFYLNPDRLHVLLDTPWRETLLPKLKRFLDRVDRAGYGSGGSYLGDIRLTNLGYDKDGEIKILDFNFTSEY